jgi:hypothetical protein
MTIEITTNTLSMNLFEFAFREIHFVLSVFKNFQSDQNTGIGCTNSSFRSGPLSARVQVYMKNNHPLLFLTQSAFLLIVLVFTMYTQLSLRL